MRHGYKRSAALGERRRLQKRKPALWVGELVTAAITHKCRVLNLSPSGAKVEVKAHVNIHDPVTLKVDLVGTFVGTVRWIRDNCVGIAFSERRFPTKRSRTFLPGALRLP